MESQLGSALRPVRSGNTFEEAVQRILQVVRLGLVPVGGKLPPERELAERLGISRVTLREALRVLQENGVLEIRRGRYGGAFVLDAAPGPGPGGADGAGGPGPAGGTAEEIDGVLRFREVLETGAAELAAERMAGRIPVAVAGTEAASALRTRLAECAAAPLDGYRPADTLLHLAIVALAGSPQLSAQYAEVRAAVNRLLDRIPLLAPNLAHSEEQHAHLVEAILAGDAPAARAVARDHARGSAALLRGFLGEAQGQEDS
ncbi:FadR/GntR family transcriptional regulator [Phaeacidiphilus oryzae]|uniref:FadR/GntR family transcriptional regulator n=1 Tax=Phaeacidiphilus oryzae TaxID=348818 RepID=UPI000564BDD1|nr:GntR family transcriptional regulator [Phaeacidiphilus oryzae]